MRILVAAIFIASVGCGSTVSYKPILKPYRFEGSDFYLPSRLRLLFQEDHSQPTVAVATVVDVGAAADPPDEPPALIPVCHGFRVAPCTGLNVLPPAHSGTLALAIAMAPLRSNRATVASDFCGTLSAKIGDP